MTGGAAQVPVAGFRDRPDGWEREKRDLAGMPSSGGKSLQSVPACSIKADNAEF